MKINLGTFKFTTSMFNYGQHSIIWIIEIDHRTSLFLIQIFIRSWQNKTWRELLFTVMIIWRWKEFSEKLQKLNGSSHYFHSLIVRRRPGGPYAAYGGPTISTNQMTVFFCRNCLFFGLNQCRNSCNLFCSVIPTSV